MFPLCVFNTHLKTHSVDAKSHWLHLFGFSPEWVFKSKCLPMQMQNHTGFICLTYFRCVFSNVSSNGLHERMQSHIDCICLTFLHCAFLNVSSNGLHEKMQSHIGCICLIFLHQPHAQGRPLVLLNLSSLLQHCSWKTDKILSLKKTKKRRGNGSFFVG